MGGCHMMPVNKTLCKGARTKPGDVVDDVMEHDAEEHTVEPPPELARELKKSKTAGQPWEELSFTHKKEMALDYRGEAGRDKTAAVGEGDAGVKDGCKLERVRAVTFGHPPYRLSCGKPSTMLTTSFS